MVPIGIHLPEGPLFYNLSLIQQLPIFLFTFTLLLLILSQ